MTGCNLELLPSEYFHRDWLVTFIIDRYGVKNREDIGVGNMMWSTDYPHHGCDWPCSRKVISEMFDVLITVMTPFPGTPLYARLLADQRILEPGAWEKCTLFDVNFRPTHMSPQELEDRTLELGCHLCTGKLTLFVING